MSLIQTYQDRGLTKNITILDANSDAITPGANDKVRVIIGREGHLGADLVDAQLVVTSDTPTANGSSITKGATNVLRLDASDLSFPPGVYTMFVDYFDNADAQEWKNVDRQVFHLETT